ncbi:MAG: AAA family ATPase [Pyrobaculum sp.]
MNCNEFFIESTRELYHIACGFMWSPNGQNWAHMASMAEGDCVFHYLSGKSLHQAQSKVIVAVSRVKGNPQFLSRDQFLGKLKSYDLNKCPLPTNFVLSKEFINYYDLWHRYYADEFNKYDEFIFVEIEVIEWLRSRISIDDIRNRIPVLKRIRGSIVQGYLTPIRREWALSILSSVFSGPAVKKIYHTLSATDFDFAILASLIAGKNLLLVGPPGSGKTSYIRDLLEGLGIDYVLRTGNPEWTTFDVVGGFDLQGRWRDGFITAAIRRSLKSKRPVWVVIDELNRANLDLALGEYFTFLDVEHRKKPFKAGDEELRVPYSFRILATMNSFDRSLLQKLGFALRRRFTVVDFARFRNLSHSKEEVEKFCERVANLPQCELQVFDSERALRVFELAESPDYAVIFSEVYDWFSENRESMLKIQVECSHAARSLDLRSLLACIIDEVNGELRGYSCEVCPVEITPGIAADALRFLAAARALDAVVSRGAPQSWRPEKLLYLLDFAVAAHVVPQLDVLSGYVQIEGDKGQAARNLSGVADKFRGWGLKASAEYAEKLSRGFNVP